MNQRRAIGVLNTDQSPQHRRRDIEVIAAIARDRGYELAQLLTINADTYMPSTYIVHEAVISGAVAVVQTGVCGGLTCYFCGAKGARTPDPHTEGLQPGGDPAERTLGTGTELFGDSWQPFDDYPRVDKSGLKQSIDEVLVLLAKGTEFRDAQVFLVETPTGEPRFA
ncbi:hypothetical protein Q3A91_01915 [Nocardia mangyaensis]|nr:hypothetical protein [Nocardia mangyaensis]MDO3645714.1 hypothetical protein [Nocardia mangyaensis]